MSCSCKCWKDKELKLTCYRCNGIVTYIKIESISEQDEKKIIIEKLRNKIKQNNIDNCLYKMEIRDIENEIFDNNNSIETVKNTSPTSSDSTSD